MKFIKYILLVFSFLFYINVHSQVITYKKPHLYKDNVRIEFKDYPQEFSSFPGFKERYEDLTKRKRNTGRWALSSGLITLSGLFVAGSGLRDIGSEHSYEYAITGMSMVIVGGVAGIVTLVKLTKYNNRKTALKKGLAEGDLTTSEVSSQLDLGLGANGLTLVYAF